MASATRDVENPVKLGTKSKNAGVFFSLFHEFLVRQKAFKKKRKKERKKSSEENGSTKKEKEKKMVGGHFYF